jgi:biopolymer transport protein ExbD
MNAEMNVTPMLDVLLVLLIIFMAALTNRMVVDAHLPEPAPVLEQREAVPIVLEVGARGYYAVNQQATPSDSLHVRLEAIYMARLDKRIIVRGTRDATYQEVLHAIDIARGAGVTVIGVDTHARTPVGSGAARPTTGSGIPGRLNTSFQPMT